MADERDRIRAMMGLSPVIKSDPVVVGGTPFGQAGSATPSTVTGSAANQYGAQTKTVIIDGKTYTGIDPTTGKPPAATTIGMVSPSSGLTITGTERNAAKEAEARALGYTKEYIASRGGINAQGYFNDTPLSGQLTAEEQKQVRLPDGKTDTNAMAAILIKKQYDEAIAAGGIPELVVQKLKSQWGNLYGGIADDGTTDVGTGGYDAQGNQIPGGQYDSKGNLVGPSGASSGLSGVSKETQDAFAILKSTLSNYGLESLYTAIEGYMKSGLGPEQAKLKIKQEPVYQARFAGNEKRRTAGLNVLSEAEYLALEDAYSQTLKAYGQQTYFGATRQARQETMAELIGGDVSATEFKDRIDLAVTRVNNADPLIKEQLKSYYKIQDADLVGYFLNPKENLPKLEEKVKAAEIGSAAAMQNLTTSMATAEDLAKFGVDLATARRGYAAIADVLPTATKLGEIYSEEGVKYDQATAEAETFKGLASAQRKRLQLAQREIAAFGGQSGISRVSLSNKAAGQF